MGKVAPRIIQHVEWVKLLSLCLNWVTLQILPTNFVTESLYSIL